MPVRHLARDWTEKISTNHFNVRRQRVRFEEMDGHVRQKSYSLANPCIRYWFAASRTTSK